MAVKNNFTTAITTTSLGLLGRLESYQRLVSVSSRDLNVSVSSRLVTPVSRSREVSLSVLCWSRALKSRVHPWMMMVVVINNNHHHSNNSNMSVLLYGDSSNTLLSTICMIVIISRTPDRYHICDLFPSRPSLT